MRKVCRSFPQFLQLFRRLVRQTQVERHARSFTCWEQLVAMLFCQLGGAFAPGELWGLASCEGKLSHLGIQAPRRSKSGVRQCTAALAALRTPLLPTAEALPGLCAAASQGLLQAQVGESGLDRP